MRPLVLRNRDFALLWLGQVLSQAGSRMYQIAILWWLLGRAGPEGGGLAVGTFLVLSALPSILLVGPIGRLVDRFPSRRILVVADVGAGLVLVAVALMGMLAILALVLDGGNTYAKRREAQNAADAGALAGAATLCRGTAGEAIAAANDYAVNRNSATSAAVSVTGSEVTVDTSIPFDTFFLSILGRPQITAEATATAGCFSPGSGIGILPIAWSCSPPEFPPVGPLDPACAILFEDENDGDDDCTWGVDPMYIIVDSTDIENDLVCEDPPPDQETYRH